MDLETAHRIQEAREDKGYTLDYVANCIGVNKSTIQRYERGQIASPKLPVIYSIARCLGVNPSWIVGKSDSKYEQSPTKSTDAQDQEFLSLFRSLSPVARELVIKQMEGIVGHKD